MTDTSDEVACARCGRDTPADKADSSGLCEACRAKIVRRATIAAHTVVALTAAGIIFVLFFLIRADPQFLLLWLVLVAGACFVLFGVVRRVVFEWFRARIIAKREG